MSYLVSVRYGCTGVCVVFCILTRAGLIHSNACNKIKQLVRVPCTDSGLLPTLGMAIQWFQACTLMGFVVPTESALRPRAYFSLRALAHYLERELRSDRLVF